MWHACDMPSLPSMIPHSWYLERGGWKSVLKSGYLHVLATNPKKYQEIKMHWCMMHGNCERYSSSWTLGCPLVWSYFYVTIGVKRYGISILLDTIGMFNPNWQWNLRMDCHHFCMFDGFPWLFPWVFHCRGLEPRFSQDVCRGPFWSKKTVNPRWIQCSANLDAYVYKYMNHTVYTCHVYAYLYRIIGCLICSNMFWMSQTGPLLFFRFCLSIHITRRGIWRYRGICRVSAAPCSAPIASGQARLGWAWAIGLW